MAEEPKPIPWEDVALIGTVNGRAAIISTVEPLSIFQTIADLVRSDLGIEGEMEEDDYESEWWDQLSVNEALERIKGIQWSLHRTEDAKAIFSAAQESEVEDKPSQPPMPLPNQMTLPISE